MAETNDRLRGEVAQVLDQVRELVAGFAETTRRHNAITATGAAEHEQITVTVDVSGAVVAVEFDEDIDDDLGYSRIARGVVTAAQRAAASARALAEAALAPQRAALARLPTLADLTDWVSADDTGELAPPAALLSAPAEREPSTVLGSSPVELAVRRAELYASATAGGKRVGVAVNADGVLIDVRFSGAIADLDYPDIATAIVAASRAAVSTVACRVTELYDQYLPADRPRFPGPAAVLTGIDRIRDQLR